MTKYEAKKVLEGMGLAHLDASFLYRCEPRYLSVGPEGSVFNCFLASHELEAIATWMRDPVGVVEAEGE